MDTTLTDQAIRATCTIEGLKDLPLLHAVENELVLRFSAPPGLYQFSGVLDASDFDWEQLYVNLHDYHNHGERTGPWDFALGTSKPLVPAYWVSVDGRRIGLWFFQRVSLEDLQRRRFRGAMAFYLDCAGEHELRLAPYRPDRVRWTSACLETDPDDRLIDRSGEWRDAEGNVPVAAWRQPAFWGEQHRRLNTTHAAYRQALTEAFDWVLGNPQPQADHLPLLIAAHKLDARAGALERARKILEQTIALPAWSNPDPEGYSHNGDIQASRTLRFLAWAYHMLNEEELDPNLRQRLVEKLRLQAGIFFDLALLNRGYWGGSVLQDHGRVSLGAYATAVLHLLGLVPEARLWASYALPRWRRSITAMPRDGAIPPSSYGFPYLYLNELTHFRPTLLALTGEDILDSGPFRPIVGFIQDMLHEKAPVLLTAPDQGGYDVVPLHYAETFFNQVAVKYGDRRAAALVERLRRTPAAQRVYADKPRHLAPAHEDVLWAFLAYDPSVRPVAPAVAPVRLTHYPDSGVAHYHDPRQDVTLTLRCGPWCGYHAWRHAPGPCDRMTTEVGAGHFVVFRGATPLLATPDSVYRLHTKVRSCLLVDDRGQIGDIGYPMSIPSWRHPGQEIQSAHFDDATGTGLIRLDLKPAYPEELGMAVYTRELQVGLERRIICRDQVVFDQPHQLSWLFHGRRDFGVKLLSDLECRFGDDPSLTIAPEPAGGVALRAGVHPSEVVHNYSSGFNEFDHVRYDSVEPVSAATVDFVLQWQKR